MRAARSHPAQEAEKQHVERALAAETLRNLGDIALKRRDRTFVYRPPIQPIVVSRI